MRPPAERRYFLIRPPSRPQSRPPPPQGADPPPLRLGEALLDGFITLRDYADTIARCRVCDRPAVCARWIDTPRPAADGPPPPVPCANAALFAELGRL